MALKLAILKIILAFPVHVSDRHEPPSERLERLTLVAESIDAAAAGRVDVAAALITLGWHESRFASWVQAGCIGTPPKGTGHCDHKRSRSPWQMKTRACPQGWSLKRGSDAAVRAFAKCAARLWLSAKKRCGSLAGAYSGYWMRCSGLKDADKRERFHGIVLRRLQTRAEGVR